MLFNYHTHTKLCNHAKGELREYVEKAIEGGLQILGFSDHAPYVFPNTDYYSYFRMKKEEILAYTGEVRSLAKEYAKDIRILCGFELEYYPLFHKKEIEFLRQAKPDYLLLGQHFSNNELDGKPIVGKCNEEELSKYVSQVLEGLATGDFLYLAHPDLAGFEVKEEIAQAEYRRLCEGAKRLGIPLEINFLHKPDKRFFKIAAEVGNETVIGCDAHTPSALYDVEAERNALQMANELGLSVRNKPLF